jgi:hypothetical protein
MYDKNTLARISKDCLAIIDNGREQEDFDPDKTVYDLKTKSITNGSIVIFVDKESGGLSSLILCEGELYWVCTADLEFIF